MEVGNDGTLQLVGVNSGSMDENGCAYGSADQFCRLQEHGPWIATVLAGKAKPWNRLSTQQRVRIIVGVSVGVIFLMGAPLGFICVKRRRARAAYLLLQT